MKIKLIAILLFLILNLFQHPSLFAQSQSIERNIVNGTAEFLTDRANENFFYIFENKLKGNQFFKYFFLNTYNMLETTNLKIILTNRDVWQNCIKKDLSKIVENFLNIIDNERKVLPKDEMEIINDLLERIQEVKIKIGDNTYQLNAQPLFLNDDEKSIYNNVYTKFENVVETGKKIKNISFNNIKSLVENKDTISQQLSEMILSFKNVNSIYKFKEFELVGAEGLRKYVDKTVSILNSIKELYELAKIVADKKMGNTYRVLNSFKIIEYLVEKLPDSTFSSEEIKSEYHKYFNNFKSYALFFAQLSEAQSKDEVKTILASVTLPPVSFGTKRDNSNHIFIASYWGLAFGIETRNRELNLKKQNTFGYFGLTAPIGIEHSWGLGKNGSVSLFVSVFDFGPVVNSQLFGNDSQMLLKDIISPGFYIIYGIPEVPLALSFGYFNSKAVKLDSSRQHHISLNVVFDMPLMIFY